MALGSGLIIQSLIDPDAIPADHFGRAMTTLMGPELPEGS